MTFNYFYDKIVLGGKVMESLNLQQYFDQSGSDYYDSKYIITILERILETSFEKIKAIVNDSKVSLTKEQIEAFLELKLIEEDPELKQRVEKRKQEHEKAMLERKKAPLKDEQEEIQFNLEPRNIEAIDKMSEEFSDRVAMIRYQFEPYTLKYFNKYIEIIKRKLLTLLDIIEKIGNKDVAPIQDYLTELDVVLDETGNVSKEDIIRLLTPTYYNFMALREKVEKANDLSTYLTLKMSIHSLMREGLLESDIYPRVTLQNKGMLGYNGNTEVKLSRRQEQKRLEETKKSIKESVLRFCSGHKHKN